MFADIEKARREAHRAAIKLVNGEAEILKLTGTALAKFQPYLSFAAPHSGGNHAAPVPKGSRFAL